MSYKKSKITPNKPKIILLLLVLIVIIFVLQKTIFSEKRLFDARDSAKAIFLNDNGISYEIFTKADDVGSFLEEKEIELKENDLLHQTQDLKIATGMEIKIDRSQKIVIEVDGEEIEIDTRAKTVGEVLKESQITLSRLDQVSPDLLAPPRKEESIFVTRINEEERIVAEDIKFKTETKESSKLGWREEKVEQKGEKGILEVKYKITYKNGKEVSRIVLEENVTKEPVTEIVTQGTYIDFGKSHTGQGTWYAQPSNIQLAYPSITGYYAANPWLAKGSYAKVTNKANGKAIIVVINDRGPFGDGRIIDLDKKAFSAIASLGAGVIDVKVEEIKN